jgi:hypothetical protein
LTVYGFPVGGRVDPAVAFARHEGSPVVHNDPAEIQKTIAFDRAVAAGQSTSIDISVRDFSIVSSIDLNSVIYSDGSHWHPANINTVKQSVYQPVRYQSTVRRYTADIGIGGAKEPDSLKVCNAMTGRPFLAVTDDSRQSYLRTVLEG